MGVSSYSPKTWHFLGPETTRVTFSKGPLSFEQPSTPVEVPHIPQMVRIKPHRYYLLRGGRGGDWCGDGELLHIPFVSATVRKGSDAKTDHQH